MRARIREGLNLIAVHLTFNPVRTREVGRVIRNANQRRMSEMRQFVRNVAVCAAVLTPGLLLAPTATAQITLQNDTPVSGVNFLHQPDIGCIGPQVWMTGGFAVGDVTNDGYPDLFIVGGGLAPDRLYVNNGDGTFTDVSEEAGVAALHGGNGVAVGDYNNDGWLDIYVTSFGPAGQPGQPGHHRLYRNNGDGTFTNVAVEAGVNQTTTDVPNGYGAAFGDYDLDGQLDLFVCSWRDTPNQPGMPNMGEGNRLFRNNGDGTFTDVTESAIGDGLAGVWGFQPAFVDMDDDLYPEILIAADFETSTYLRNNGDGTFSNVTPESGTGLDDNGMGQTTGDFNNNGLQDWYVTSIHKNNPLPGDNVGNMLYVNQGEHQYAELSHEAGVNDGGWGWGTIAADLNNDGWLDILEVNGRDAAGEWANERGYLFANNGDGTFDEVGLEAGFDHVGEGRGIAWFDADRDGRLDFAVSVNLGELEVYRNLSNGPTGKPNSFLHLTFDTSNNPLLPANGFGTHVTAAVGEMAYTRVLSGSPSYLATSELIVHLGLGDADVIDELRIRWSRGYETVLHDVPANQFLTVQAPDLADLSADGMVGTDDLAMLVDRWGPVITSSALVADINNDGVVDGADLAILLGAWTEEGGGAAAEVPVPSRLTPPVPGASRR